jgi:hypothetical protein
MVVMDRGLERIEAGLERRSAVRWKARREYLERESECQLRHGVNQPAYILVN